MASLGLIRELTPRHLAQAFIVPIVAVIGGPALLLTLLCRLSGINPWPAVSVFLGDATTAALPTIGVCLLAWLAYASTYWLIVSSRPIVFLGALRDVPIPVTTIRWKPAVVGWRLFNWFGLRKEQLVLTAHRTVGEFDNAWSPGTHPTLVYE